MDNRFFKKSIDYDLDLEESVLGIFLLEPDAFGSAFGLVEKDCFFEPNHQLVFKHIEDYWKSGGQIDLLTIARTFYDKGIEYIGHSNIGYFLASLSHKVISSAHLRTWCLFLRELYAKRIMHIATNGGVKGDDIFQQAGNIQNLINKALEIRSNDDWLNGSKVAEMLLESMDKAKDGDIGVTTSINLLDDINGGFKGGQFIVLGARPSVGKSAFFGRIAVRAAAKGKKIGVISLEMVAKDVFARMVAAETDVPFYQIDRNQLVEESQRNLVYNGINSVSKLPIYFSETAQVNIHDIRAKADKLNRRYGLDLLIIDYLQLIEGNTTKNKNRENEVSEISRGVKLIAMNMNIPVIALAQLNRNVEGRKGKDRHPQLSDLRESGSLEQDADIVMFLHRDFISGVTEDENGNSTESQADLFVRKWRNGSTAEIKLHFKGDTMKFSDEAEINKKEREKADAELMPNPYKSFQNRDFSQPKTISFDYKAPF